MAKPRVKWISLGIVGVLAAACAPQASHLAVPAMPNTTQAQAADTRFDSAGNSQTEIMVSLRGAKDLADLKANAARDGYVVTRAWPQINAAAIKVGIGATRGMVQTLKRNAGIVSATPAQRVILEAEPNDAMYGEQYGMKLMQVAQAWDLVPGDRKIPIALIDTGVDLTHPDLKDKLLPGYCAENPGASVQDDGSHGTHTAGIAAAAANNGVGVIGVGGQCSILPVKALGNQGSKASITDGVIWAADHGARVISMSLGLYKSAPVFEKALQYALDKNVVLVASAGNNNAENDPVTAPHLPSTYPGVIEVAATDANDKKASFSNFGKTVTVAAPGVDVLSTVPGGRWAKKSGTSMACPHVAGLAGLILSKHPNWTVAQVTKALKDSAQDFGAPGFDPIFGFGRVNALNAVKL